MPAKLPEQVPVRANPISSLSSTSSKSIAAFLLAGSLFLIGCAPASDDSGARIVPDKFYDKAQCQVQPDTGDEAVFPNSSRDDVVVSRYFGKKYDRADLEAVMGASAVSTGVYIQQAGVEIYHVPRSSGTVCPMYASLPAVPSDIRAIWDDASKGVNDGALAGLYFEYCTSSCAERETTRPVILLDEASDRWTIVHEFMHHNYNKERKADSAYPTTNRLRSLMHSSMTRFDAASEAYKRSKSRWDLDEMASELDRVTKTLYQILIQSNFEEIALESQLLDEWASGRLKHVSRDSARSAAWYIKYSREAGLMRFDTEILPRIGQIIDEASYSGQNWPDIAEKAYATRTFIREIEDATLEILRQAQRKIGTTNDVNLLMTSVSPIEEVDPRAAAMLRHHLEHLDGSDLLAEFDQKAKLLKARLASDKSPTN